MNFQRKIGKKKFRMWRKGRKTMKFRRKSNVGSFSLITFFHLKKKCAKNTVIFFRQKILATKDTSVFGGFGGFGGFGMTRKLDQIKNNYWGA